MVEVRWKTCSTCRNFKPRADYSADRRTGDGLQARCRECGNASLKEYYRSHPHLTWDRNLRAAYNITADDYTAILERQGGACAICGEKPKTKRLAVDHDHRCCPSSAKSCGKCVRGLLCARCNMGMILLDAGLLDKAIAYKEGRA